MSFNVTTAHVQQYKDNVEFLLQQKDSRLQQAVSVRSDYVGKNVKFIEQLGQVAMQKKTTRHGDVSPVNTPHDARWVAPDDYELAEYVDDQDKLRMLIDPTSYYAQNFKFSANRAKDDAIINAFFGTAQTGENGTTSVAWATFVSANPGHQIAAGTSGLTIAKLRAARKALRAAENDEDDPMFCLVTAEEEDDLLNEIQVVSADYNWGPDGAPVLRDGKVQKMLGFNFIHSERLTLSGANRRVPAWCKSGMHLAVWADVYTSVDRIPTKGKTMQVYTCATFNAARTQEKKVVEILAA